MEKSNLKSYLLKAKKESFALPQFNFSSPHQLRAILKASIKLNSPLILGTSTGEANFLSLDYVVQEVNFWKEKILKEENKNWPLFLNLDHAKNLSLIEKALSLGYDMVHFDGSDLPFQENIKITKEVKKMAESYGALMEAEVGKIATSSSQIYEKEFKINPEDLTSPQEAKLFVEETKADLLAVSIGTFHGIQAKGKNPHLFLDLLEEICNFIPQTFLVLHGSSGTPEEDIKKSIKIGINKVNINTELRLAFFEGLKEKICKEKEIKPYKYLAKAEENLEKEVSHQIILLGSENKIETET